MNIGVYGGTFNPPHLGHFAAAKTAVEVLGLDKLLLIPAAVPPHKPLPEGSPSPAHRLEMVARMADAMNLPEVVEVSGIELERQGKSYTRDTLLALNARYPDAKLFLLMGTDMFLSVHQWHDPAAILQLASICAFGRTQADGEGLFAPQRDYLVKEFGAEITTIILPELVDISSTQLREQLEQGSGQAYLLPSVYGYLLLHQLYGTHENLKQLPLSKLRACSYSMVKQKRVPHIMGTEEEAVRLAKRWGADETLARRAAILHDCTKYLPLQSQLELCQEYGVELDPLEQQAPKLLHSKTGACIARAVFGEADEVYQAIFWHTTAKENMTTLEKIIYLSDYIEPNRNFQGVEHLRTLAYESLDKALLLGVETTIQEMEQRQLTIHSKTLLAREWLWQQGIKIEE